mmetsp:Transcript_47781/g.123955  ORF Transcript_47781/g.123955 Transcript_47781/m.123955 type:complete len:110 (+) Transcript_47781:323-652(+)
MPGHWFSLPHGWCEAVAGGIMLGAAFGLFAEAGENKLGTFLALIGAGIGVASIALISKWLSKQVMCAFQCSSFSLSALSSGGVCSRIHEQSYCTQGSFLFCDNGGAHFC